MPYSSGNRWLSSGEVARRLRVDASRVRRLAANGRLPARKVGHDWLFDADLLNEANGAHRQRGRPFAPENALGMLFVASGDDAPWLKPHARSRLRRVARASLLPVLPRLRARAEKRSYRAPDALIRKLAEDAGFVLSGASASEHHGMRLVAKGILEGYLDERRLKDLEYRHALERVPEQAANLIVHAIDRRLLPASRVMPRAVVAADLADSADERSRRVGERALRETR